MDNCVNLQLLREMLAGYRQQYIADRLGISRPTFINRMEGRQPFTIDEVNRLVWLLRLTPDETMAVFFNGVIDYKETA